MPQLLPTTDTSTDVRKKGRGGSKERRALSLSREEAKDGVAPCSPLRTPPPPSLTRRRTVAKGYKGGATQFLAHPHALHLLLLRQRAITEESRVGRGTALVRPYDLRLLLLRHVGQRAAAEGGKRRWRRARCEGREAGEGRRRAHRGGRVVGERWHRGRHGGREGKDSARDAREI